MKVKIFTESKNYEQDQSDIHEEIKEFKDYNEFMKYCLKLSKRRISIYNIDEDDKKLGIIHNVDIDNL